MDTTDWVKLCNIDFVKRFNNPEALLHFKRLTYFRGQGSNTIKASSENIKIKEVMNGKNRSFRSNDLHKPY